MVDQLRRELPFRIGRRELSDLRGVLSVVGLLGGEFKLNEAWILRAGVAFDETPTHIETRTPRLPDADRMWYSIGATWQATPALEVNFGYTRIEPDSPEIDLHADAPSLQTLTGPFDGHANLYGVSAQYKF